GLHGQCTELAISLRAPGRKDRMRAAAGLARLAPQRAHRADPQRCRLRRLARPAVGLRLYAARGGVGLQWNLVRQPGAADGAGLLRHGRAVGRQGWAADPAARRPGMAMRARSAPLPAHVSVVPGDASVAAPLDYGLR